KPMLTRKSRDPRGDESEGKIAPLHALVFVGIAFGVGILAEDLSYKFVDNVETPFKTLPATIASLLLPEEMNDRLGLPSKEGSRIRTLITNIKTSPVPKPLAIDLAGNHAFSIMDANNGKRIDDW